MAALGGERIDIIEWSEDQAAFIKEALSPATITEVVLDEEGHRATVTVSEDQQSLAIGRGGQNVRLAAKLTGWNIDIASVGGENTAETAEAIETPKGASDESVAEADNAEDLDPAVAAGIDPTETESVITEEAPEDSALTMEEETTRTDDGNESVSDAQESRDEA
jgi:N utilization substance protein A